MKKEQQGQLKRAMRPIDVWGLALGAIIGWGCFVLPGNAFLPKAGPLGTAVGMAIGAALILVIALSYGYLIRKFPLSGGEFIYTKKTMGKTNAFICGWGMILAYWSLIPLNATALGMISRYLFPGIIQRGLLYTVAGWEVYAGEVAVASLFIILMAIVNIYGIKQAAWTQTTIALTLVAGIFMVAFLILTQGPDWSNLAPAFPEGHGWWKGVFAIVAMAPWAFIGFDCIPQSAEEYNFNHKKSTRIMVLAIAIAALLYIVVNTITALGFQDGMSWEEMLVYLKDSNQIWATGYVVKQTLGIVGLTLLGIAMFCAVISGMNAFYISTSRLMYAMAQDGALPSAFSKLGVKHGTPRNAILFVMVLSLFAPWFGREVLNWIVDMTSVGAAIVFAYTTASAAIWAIRHNHKTQAWISFFGCIISLFFLSLLIIPGMPGYLSIQSRVILLVWIVIGAVFYALIYDKYKKKSDENVVEEAEK